MAHHYDINDKFIAVDSVENSVISLPDTIPIITRELLVPRRSWIIGETLNSSDNSDSVGFRKGLDFLGR